LPGDTTGAGPYSSYQQFLLGVSDAGGSSCTATLQQYFTELNTPANLAD
jgi:hypothetical protein